MSYDIYIGEAVPGGKEWGLALVVEGIDYLEGAPAFPGDEMTGCGNGRHPGYSQWGEAMKNVGLWSMFFNPVYGLMRSHPGTHRLTPVHAIAINAALRRWKANHPPLEPGWCSCRACEPTASRTAPTPPHVERDNHLARLLWLEFWVGWALKNCKNPALHNR